MTKDHTRNSNPKGGGYGGGGLIKGWVISFVRTMCHDDAMIVIQIPSLKKQ